MPEIAPCFAQYKLERHRAFTRKVGEVAMTVFFAGRLEDSDNKVFYLGFGKNTGELVDVLPTVGKDLICQVHTDLYPKFCHIQ